MKTALQIGLTAILVGALAFFGGVKYGQMSGRAGLAVRFGGQAGGQGGGSFGQGGQNGNAAQRFRAGGGFVNGDVISADSKSITVKMQDGSTKTVYFDANTRIAKSSEATSSDLTKGLTVVVVGTAGSDGSVTARNIQIIPKGSNLGILGTGMRGFGGPNGGPNGGGTGGGYPGGGSGGGSGGYNGGGQPPVTQ